MKKKINKGALRTFFKVMKYLKLYKIHFALSLLLTALGVILTLYVPILVGKAIDLAMGEGKVDIDGIKAILIKIAVMIAVTAIAQWIIGLLNNRMTYVIVKNIRTIRTFYGSMFNLFSIVVHYWKSCWNPHCRILIISKYIPLIS